MVGVGALNVCTSQLLYSLITLKKLFFWGRGSGGFSRWVRGPHSGFLFLLSPHHHVHPLKLYALLIYLNPLFWF